MEMKEETTEQYDIFSPISLFVTSAIFLLFAISSILFFGLGGGAVGGTMVIAIFVIYYSLSDGYDPHEFRTSEAYVVGNHQAVRFIATIVFVLLASVIVRGGTPIENLSPEISEFLLNSLGLGVFYDTGDLDVDSPANRLIFAVSGIIAAKIGYELNRRFWRVCGELTYIFYQLSMYVKRWLD